MIDTHGRFGYGETLCEGLTFAFITKEQQPNPWMPTLFSLVYWEFPRSNRALGTLNNELGSLDYPSIYVLMETKFNKLYIGETKSVIKCLTLHISTPQEKIKNWDRAIIINDARNSSHSDFNDENIRLVLEDFLVRLFRINKYKVVTSSSRTPSLSSTQKTLCESFKEEIVILLTNKSKIAKTLRGRRDDERYLDDVKRVLEQGRRNIQKWSNAEAIIGGSKVFIRPGSPKPSGWQVTFRGGKSDSSKSMLAAGNGFLLMPRGPIMFIPMEVIKELVSKIDTNAFKRDTVDVFIRFDDNKIILIYKREEQDVTEFAIENLSLIHI